MLSILLRLIIACIVGTLIGIKINPYFTRTFTIICSGVALLTIVSLEFFKVINYPWFSDPGRLTAQVIAALGFLGTGLIWVSSAHEVRGLSVAASIWLTAILGIIIGSGLSKVTMIIVGIVLIAFFFWNKMENGNN